MESVETKICSTCSEEKPLDLFHKDSNRPDGRRSSCRECRSLKNAKDEATLPPEPAPPADPAERQALARARAIKDVIYNHEREFRSRYVYWSDRLELQASWHKLT